MKLDKTMFLVLAMITLFFIVLVGILARFGSKISTDPSFNMFFSWYVGLFMINLLNILGTLLFHFFLTDLPGERGLKGKPGEKGLEGEHDKCFCNTASTAEDTENNSIVIEEAKKQDDDDDYTNTPILKILSIAISIIKEKDTTKYDEYAVELETENKKFTEDLLPTLAAAQAELAAAQAELATAEAAAVTAATNAVTAATDAVTEEETAVTEAPEMEAKLVGDRVNKLKDGLIKLPIDIKNAQILITLIKDYVSADADAVNATILKTVASEGKQAGTDEKILNIYKDYYTLKKVIEVSDTDIFAKLNEITYTGDENILTLITQKLSPATNIHSHSVTFEDSNSKEIEDLSTSLIHRHPREQNTGYTAKVGLTSEDHKHQ